MQGSVHRVALSRHSAMVVDLMGTVGCLPTVQRVASQVKVVCHVSSSDVICCACTLVYQLVSSTSYDLSSTLSTTSDFFQDLSPSLKGFIITVSPSCIVGRSRSDLVAFGSSSVDPFLVSVRNIVTPVTL